LRNPLRFELQRQSHSQGGIDIGRISPCGHYLADLNVRSRIGNGYSASRLRRFPERDSNKPAAREALFDVSGLAGRFASPPTQQYDTGECLNRSGAVTTDCARKGRSYSIPIKQSSCQTYSSVRPSRVIGSALALTIIHATRQSPGGTLPIKARDFWTTISRKDVR
jgi:hypothetical protein